MRVPPLQDELTSRELRYVLGLGNRELLTVHAERGWPALTPHAGVPPELLALAEYRKQKRADRPGLVTIMLPALVLLLASLADRVDAVLFAIALLTSMAAALAALVGVTPSRRAVLVASGQGIVVRSGSRRDTLAWSDVTGLAQTELAGLVCTAQAWFVLDLMQPEAERLFDAAKRVVQARDSERPMHLTQPASDAALSLTDPNPADSPDQRAISLTHSDDD